MRAPCNLRILLSSGKVRGVATQTPHAVSVLPRSLFDGSQVDAATRRLNSEVEQDALKSFGMEKPWELPAARVRASHTAGFANKHRADRREDTTVPPWQEDDPRVKVSIFRPMDAVKSSSVYLHVHGGGWVLGSARGQNDQRLVEWADSLGMVVVAVDYRLAPEHKFPAALHDTLAAARWLLNGGVSTDGAHVPRAIIGGESAGGQLALLTLLALQGHGSAATGTADAQDGLGGRSFMAANLVYGVYDLALSHGCRAFGDRALCLNYPYMQWFVDNYLTGSAWDHARQSPEVSPVYAPNLSGLPPALFTIGTEDPLLEDSLMMHARYAAAGNGAELALYPGGAHGIGCFGPHEASTPGIAARRYMEDWLRSFIASGDAAE